VKRKGIGPDGLVIVDKPAGITSHTVVARIRRLAGTRKVGHAGTLDPMATGVLVVGSEKATRLLGHLALTTKTYEATIRLGQTTVTDDAEGEVTGSTAADADTVTDEAVATGVAKLTGAILQVPSSVSAIKIDGKRSYARVREGEEVELAARPVTVSRFEVHARRAAVAEDGTAVVDLDVTVDCSSGTYIRALARDLGADLGVGGHLTALRRTRVGAYGLDLAYTLEELEDGFTEKVLPIADAAAAAFPRWDVDEKQARLIATGVRIDGPGMGLREPIAVFDPEGRFLALIEEQGGKAKSVAVFV
jgi:tRNA pseudouridine55 synthase